MEREELIDRLKGYEWNDVEFKAAQRDVPQSAYDTVSAFANTEGGWLVFGVRDAGAFEIVGVLEVDKVQNDFLSALRTGQKLSRVIASKEALIEQEGKVLLVFHIPEARRQDKPVYLKRDIRRSFIRRGAGDERCTPTEIERMLRDAADERYDGDTLDLDPESCFDDDSLHWYRKLFEDRSSGEDEGLPHLDFLRNWGLVTEADGRFSPTRAAILLFGTATCVPPSAPAPGRGPAMAPRQLVGGVGGRTLGGPVGSRDQSYERLESPRGPVPTACGEALLGGSRHLAA